ncbi:MAG: hypothetical protein ABW352_12130 [Polyangiales bacterium]
MDKLFLRSSWLVVLAACAGDEGATPSPMEPSAIVDAGRLDARITEPVVARDAAAPSERADAQQGTTFSQHVAPILARACVSCHSQGQIAPFSLDGYELAKPFAKLAAKAARSRSMPPSVVDNTGACNTFRDLPWLSEEEISTLERWADEGAEAGDPDMPMPAARELPRLTGDVRKIKTPSYTPSTAKPDDYRCFVVDSPVTETSFVTGYDTHPGNTKVAHHMVVFYPMDDGSGLLARLLDELDPQPGYDCYGAPGVPATTIVGWAPGGGATVFPDHLGVEVAPTRPLIVQMHYNTSGGGAIEPDSTEIELKFEKDASPAALMPMLDLEMNLPPGMPDAKEVVTRTFADRIPGRTEPVQIYGAFPHMHELGKNISVTIGDGDEESCLVDAPRYSFHWQRLYFLDKPVTVDANTPIHVNCTFDTTSRKEVTSWGEGTQEEMCVAGLFVKL